MSKNYPSYLDLPREKKPQTNFDKIKAMTIEEIEQIITCPGEHQICSEFMTCKECRMNWLESEVTK